MVDNSPEKRYDIISKEEKKLLEVLRSIQYGQVVVIMQAGKPIRIEHIKESIVL